ncbi:hypothetical protein B4096_1400 [Heyndrickxia coagulans]|jgi:hypothetical protein|uniref:Uncharacterized protein n=1 Tax=Heyndrickxia coagulans TaxID=1398 RepID=A0AAN0T3B5_HEYCO|nr:hypothetical protein SB48_HM08orf00139 [Heyndrickxia coagulans]KYC63648.1 hypothetical protein B4100_1492 [Heyndrickxia coagulans]KYC88580.1 hypothetical protein B4096_1400 [Heyndrickxia coagulans]
MGCKPSRKQWKKETHKTLHERKWLLLCPAWSGMKEAATVSGEINGLRMPIYR